MNKQLISVEEVKTMANNIAASGLFPDVNTKEKAFTLMMLCQSEGLHPMQALKRYNIIQNRPAMKADAMLAEFNSRGGTVNWIEYNEKSVEAEFRHPNGTKLKVKWTVEMASKIKQSYKDRSGNKKEYPLTAKDNWKNYPRQMLKARVISEGLRAIMPEVCVGIYTPEEVQDFAEATPGNGKPIEPSKVLEPPKAKKEVEKQEALPENQEGGEEPPEEEPPRTNGGEIKEINERFKALRDALGADDFKTVLKNMKIKSLKGITIKTAKEIIKAMEITLGVVEDESEIQA